MTACLRDLLQIVRTMLDGRVDTDLKTKVTEFFVIEWPHAGRISLERGSTGGGRMTFQFD